MIMKHDLILSVHETESVNFFQYHDRELQVLKQQLREKDELVTAVQKPEESFQG